MACAYICTLYLVKKKIIKIFNSYMYQMNATNFKRLSSLTIQHSSVETKQKENQVSTLMDGVKTLT